MLQWTRRTQSLPLWKAPSSGKTVGAHELSSKLIADHRLRGGREVGLFNPLEASPSSMWRSGKAFLGGRSFGDLKISELLHGELLEDHLPLLGT